MIKLKRIVAAVFATVLMGFAFLSMGGAVAAKVDCSADPEKCKLNPVCYDDEIDSVAKKEAGCDDYKDSTKNAEKGVANAIEMVLVVVGIIGVMFVTYGGVLYILSGGDTTKATTAKTVIRYAVIGLVVVILSYAIVAFVNTNVL
ncbi:MAG: hypothetical protein LBQ02_02150 [Candidatus Nomurabacteria bacterium]|jgi:hypothetical protein|nr:hypothetical protein [Candidatus Nomurabacteria bacterium]